MAPQDVEIIKYLTKYRQDSGSYMVLVWLLLMLPFLLDGSYKLFVWGSTGVMFCFDLCNHVYRKIPDTFFETRPMLVRKLFIGIILVFSLYLSGVSAYLFYDQDFSSIHISVALVMAFSTINGFSVWLLSPLVGRIVMTMLFLPSIAVMSLSEHLGHTITAVFMVFCVLLLLKQGDVRAKHVKNSILRQARFKEQASKYREISQIDPLTDIGNRRYFDTCFSVMVDDAIEEGGALSILIVDIDHFKQINDQYGHAAGDVCLQNAAKLLKKEVRSALDVLCRFGGEEFVIILNGVDVNDSKVIAERICASFRDHPNSYEGNAIPWTACVGISTLEQENISHEALFKRADNALYAAKNQGRDRAIHGNDL